MRPRSVAIATALLAMMGVAAIYLGFVNYGLPGLVGRGDSPWLVVGGVAALIASAMVWFATPAARLAGMALAIFALLPGLYGLGGLGVVAQTFQECQNRATTSLTFTSYPEGYCATVSWPYQFGIGIGLIAVGAAGLFVIFALAANRDYFGRASVGRFHAQNDGGR